MPYLRQNSLIVSADCTSAGPPLWPMGTAPIVMVGSSDTDASLKTLSDGKVEQTNFGRSWGGQDRGVPHPLVCPPSSTCQAGRSSWSPCEPNQTVFSRSPN